jgi:hypothetical protein
MGGLLTGGAAAGVLVGMARTQVRTTPQAATTKWTSHLQGATTDMTAGVQRVTVAPGELAAAKFDKWLAGIQASAEKWRSRVKSVSLASWQQSMVSIGIPRAAEGASKKANKYEAFATEFYPFLESQMAKVNAMDDSTYAARKAKASAMMDALHGWKRPSTSGS